MACSASSSTALLSSTSRASISPKSHISQSLFIPSAFNGLRNCKPFVSRVARSISTRVAQSERRRFAVRASSELPLVGNQAPDFEAEAVFDQEFIKVETGSIQDAAFLNAVVKVVGWKGAGGSGSENSKLFNSFDGIQEEYDWNDVETDLYRWTKTLRPVQWYPGHIAKTEKELKEQLKLMDVVIEVRDARIPMSTSHPQMDSWLGNRKRILVLNREDMISTADRNAWATYYANQGIKVVFSNGQLGMGALKLGRLAKALAGTVNIKRKAKGLLPRPVRAGVVGYPNVGKSSLVNRLLKRRMCAAAPRPGVTREMKWVHFGKDLELLDSPGIIPMRISDQTSAIKLAICDDIGERSYDATDVAAILVQMLSRLPTVGNKALCDRYKIEADGHCGKIFVQKLAVQLFNADNNQAAFRILQDFRKGKFGWIALERPPK